MTYYPDVISYKDTPDIWAAPEFQQSSWWTYFSVASELDWLLEHGFIKGPRASRVYASYKDRFYAAYEYTPSTSHMAGMRIDPIDYRFYLLPAPDTYTHKEPRFMCRGVNHEDPLLPQQLWVLFSDGCQALVFMTNERGYDFVNTIWRPYMSTGGKSFQPLPDKSDTYFWEKFAPFRERLPLDFYYKVDLGDETA